jgi:hypothetical protein
MLNIMLSRFSLSFCMKKYLPTVIRLTSVQILLQFIFPTRGALANYPPITDWLLVNLYRHVGLCTLRNDG